MDAIREKTKNIIPQGALDTDPNFDFKAGYFKQKAIVKRISEKLGIQRKSLTQSANKLHLYKTSRRLTFSKQQAEALCKLILKELDSQEIYKGKRSTDLTEAYNKLYNSTVA